MVSQLKVGAWTRTRVSLRSKTSHKWPGWCIVIDLSCIVYLILHSSSHRECIVTRTHFLWNTYSQGKPSNNDKGSIEDYRKLYYERDIDHHARAACCRRCDRSLRDMAARKIDGMHVLDYIRMNSRWSDCRKHPSVRQWYDRCSIRTTVLWVRSFHFDRSSIRS